MDTGSNWLWVNSRICDNCNPKQPKFDETKSSSFGFMDAVIDLHYGTGSVYGYDSFDQVCISETVCAKEFSFLSVMHQSGLSNLECSGIIGLSPKKSEKMGDLFID
tara:strand:+ start:404 stop:721 length:318 start_codon:yes stop_codon:yes gene_type:complete